MEEVFSPLEANEGYEPIIRRKRYITALAG